MEGLFNRKHKALRLLAVQLVPVYSRRQEESEAGMSDFDYIKADKNHSTLFATKYRPFTWDVLGTSSTGEPYVCIESGGQISPPNLWRRWMAWLVLGSIFKWEE